jgi:hypothetical protein
MKTKALILLMAVLFVASNSFALKTDGPRMNIVQVESDEALVAFESKVPTYFELTISNNEHVVVYYQKSKKQQQEFKGKFNFANLENGTYNVCVNYGNQSLNSQIEITNKGIETSEVVRCYEPYFTIEDEKLNVSFLNTPQKQVYLNIYKNNKHVDGTALGKDLVIHKKLDLSNLAEGKYQVILTDEFKDHVYWVKI